MDNNLNGALLDRNKSNGSKNSGQNPSVSVNREGDGRNSSDDLNQDPKFDQIQAQPSNGKQKIVRPNKKKLVVQYIIISLLSGLLESTSSFRTQTSILIGQDDQHDQGKHISLIISMICQIGYLMIMCWIMQPLFYNFLLKIKYLFIWNALLLIPALVFLYCVTQIPNNSLHYVFGAFYYLTSSTMYIVVKAYIYGFAGYIVFLYPELAIKIFSIYLFSTYLMPLVGYVCLILYQSFEDSINLLKPGIFILAAIIVAFFFFLLIYCTYKEVPKENFDRPDSLCNVSKLGVKDTFYKVIVSKDYLSILCQLTAVQLIQFCIMKTFEQICNIYDKCQHKEIYPKYQKQCEAKQYTDEKLQYGGLIIFYIACIISISFSYWLSKKGIQIYKYTGFAAVISALPILLCSTAYSSNNQEFFFALALIFGLVQGFFSLAAYSRAILGCERRIDVLMISIFFNLIIEAIMRPIHDSNKEDTDKLFNIYFGTALSLQIVFSGIMYWQKGTENMTPEQMFEQNRQKYIQETLDETKQEIDHNQFRARYRYVSKLGTGSFGRVYKYQDMANQPSSQNDSSNNDQDYEDQENGGLMKSQPEYVAVKKIQTSDENRFLQFSAEIEIMKKVQGSKFIVKLQKYCKQEQPEQDQSIDYQVWIVMEFCPRTLREEIVYRSDKDDGYFEKEQFYWLAYCIVAANKELKEKNIYHGDIKPENILKKDKNYKLADFGEANEDSKTDKKGIVQGSPPYMSPEMMANYNAHNRANTKYNLNQTSNSGKQLKKDRKSGGTQISNYSVVKEIDMFKSDVFSIGLTLLNALLLEDVSGLNKNRDALASKLNELEHLNNCDDKINQVMKSMLVWDPEYRLSIEELFNLMENNSFQLFEPLTKESQIDTEIDSQKQESNMSAFLIR